MRKAKITRTTAETEISVEIQCLQRFPVLVQPLAIQSQL